MKTSDRRDFLKVAAGSAAVVAIQPELFALAPRLSAKIRVGVVGTGRQGRAILGELAKFKDVEVAALCDTIPSRLRSAKRRARNAQDFPTVGDLLDKAKDVDAVFVATPTHTHKDVAVAAMSGGKHVFCESPLAHTIADCRAIATTARGSKKVFQTGMQGRANPIYKLARSFVRSGAIRDVVSMRAQFHRKTSWRTPSADPQRAKALNWKLDPEISLGLLGEFGIQQFDVCHWMTSQYPTSVQAHGSVLAWDDGREVPDTVHCNFGFDDGPRLAYEATLANSFEGQYELFEGSMGTVKLSWTAGWMFKEADAATQGWEVYANRQQFHNDEGITLIANATKLAEQGKLKEGVGLPHPPLYYAIESFLKSVTEGKEVVCSADEGLRAAVVGIQAHESLRTGKTLPIDRKLFTDK